MSYIRAEETLSTPGIVIADGVAELKATRSFFASRGGLGALNGTKDGQ